MKTLISVIVLVGVVAGGAAYYTKYISAEPPPTFRTATIEHGDVASTISATGTIEPEEVVDVGAQVIGRIKEFGKDPSDPTGKKPIDYCSVVHDGTVLAYIDDAVYRAERDQTKAELDRAKADVKQMQAKLLQATQDRRRAEQLREANTRLGRTDANLRVISETDYDLAVANHEVAKANVAVAEAALEQAEASLRLAQTNLDYTVIKSPVEGVIVDRRVNVGQTVVASLNAPSLFLIAKDLRHMQVWASVNEADIGRIRPGLPVRFMVDAFPNDVFDGTVAQIRLNATMTQNVVMYTVVVAFDNSDLKLKPYLTANLQFEVETHRDVLLVPVAALRFEPRPELIAPDVQQPQASPADAGQTDSAEEQPDRGRVWVKDGDYLRPVEVQTGITDGWLAEVSGSAVRQGMTVVLSEVRADQDSNAETTNPFTPKFFRRRVQ